MTAHDNAIEYYYPGKPCRLIITASCEAIKKIEFTESFSVLSTHELPPVVKNMFTWLDLYSEKKEDCGFDIIFAGRKKPRTGSHDTSVEKPHLVLDVSGFTEKEINVYRELLEVRPGETVSYGLLADRSGIPGGARFIGNTMARNRFPVLVPCHRVVKSDGSLGNFSGGVHLKERLLAHEAGGFSPARMDFREGEEPGAFL